MESLTLTSKPPIQQQIEFDQDKGSVAQPTYKYQMKRRMVRILQPTKFWLLAW